MKQGGKRRIKYESDRKIVQTFMPNRELVAHINEVNTGTGKTLVDCVREGLAFEEFEALAEMFLMPEDALAAALDIPRATLHRRKKLGHLAREESERVVRFARVFGLAVDLFGNEEAAREWLKEPAIAFGDQTPLRYMDTEVGARMVEDLLGRIGHGVFA